MIELDYILDDDSESYAEECYCCGIIGGTVVVDGFNYCPDCAAEQITDNSFGVVEEFLEQYSQEFVDFLRSKIGEEIRYGEF